jgi:TonB family protein
MLLLLGSGVGKILCGKDVEFPTAIYVVSIVTSDASPFWYYYVLDVTAEGRDSIVRYVRVAPFDSMCAEAVTVKAMTKRLPGVSLSELTPQGNLCAVNAASINRDLRRRTRTAAIDDSVRFGIVASCGSRTVALHLPFPEQVKLERLRKTAPQLARWWDIQQSIKDRAFGAGQVFYNVTAAQEEELQREGQTVVPELLSGRFDAGLQAVCPPGKDCRPASFRDELRFYVGPVGRSANTPKLAQASQYKFRRYVDPKYPPLAMQARIAGTVKLELSVDKNSGETRDIKVLLGHPVFLPSVMDAVKQWQFVPEELPARASQIPADIVFEWTCPKPLQRQAGGSVR